MDSLVISIVDVFSDLKLYLKNNGKLKLNKKSKEGHFTNIIKELKHEKSSEEFGEYINNFAWVLNNNFSKDDLQNFKKNIRGLSAYGIYFQVGDIFRFDTFLGRYDTINNSISIDLRRDKNKSSIYHELFHMASTRVGDRVIDSGFHHYMGEKISVGEGLNEGYTDLLTKRYFNETGYETYYNKELIYASLLEQIVGKEKMESLYLKGDLRGLMSELEKYDTLDNIKHFINEIDYIRKSDGIVVDRQRIYNMNYFLIDAYIRKKVLNGESLNDKNVGMDIMRFYNSVPTEVKVGDNVIKMDNSIILNESVAPYIQNIDRRNFR